jgi:hypothetical protein
MMSTRLLILLLLLYSVHGAPKPSRRKEKLQSLKPLSPDYDNRYVWFTRDLPNERRNLNELQRNNIKRFLHRISSTMKVKRQLST